MDIGYIRVTENLEMLAAVLENELSNLLQIVNAFLTYFWIYPPQLKGDPTKRLN